MKRMLIFSGALGVALAFYYRSMLPAMAALNFGFDGRADGYAGRGIYLIITGGLHLFLTGIFYYLPLLMTKIPLDFTNLPNKEYWFSAEHKEETVRKISAQMCLFGTITNIFLIFCSGMTYRANITDNKSLDAGTFITGLLIYLAVTVIWAVKFNRGFSIIEKSR